MWQVDLPFVDIQERVRYCEYFSVPKLLFRKLKFFEGAHFGLVTKYFKDIALSSKIPYFYSEAYRDDTLLPR
jgi:hypothetical protein